MINIPGIFNVTRQCIINVFFFYDTMTIDTYLQFYHKKTHLIFLLSAILSIISDPFLAGAGSKGSWMHKYR